MTRKKDKTLRPKNHRLKFWAAVVLMYIYMSNAVTPYESFEGSTLLPDLCLFVSIGLFVSVYRQKRKAKAKLKFPSPSNIPPPPPDAT